MKIEGDEDRTEMLHASKEYPSTVEQYENSRHRTNKDCSLSRAECRT